VLFNAKGIIKRYKNPLEIIEEFWEHRIEIYKKRKGK
jgi:DNA gyrase/topoisomerase IV subunit A